MGRKMEEVPHESSWSAAFEAGSHHALVLVLPSNYYGSMSKLSTVDQTSVYQENLVALTRAFGWHRPSTTPCGKPVPIAEAHALLELSKVESLTRRGGPRTTIGLHTIH